MKSEHDSFRENFRHMQAKITMLENEAHLYSDKLDQYLKHFDTQKAQYETLVTKVQDTFFETQKKIVNEFDDLKRFVNIEMYQPMREFQHVVDAHTDHLK